MPQHFYGYTPDIPDFRDHQVAEGSVFFGAAVLPGKIDHRPQCSRIENQLDLNSCTMFSIVGSREHLEIKDGGEYVEFSHLFPWWFARKLEGSTRENVGVYLRDAIKAVASYGTCLESLWPYRTSRYQERPSQEACADASRRRITEYARVSRDTTAVKRVLASGFTVIVGLTLYESFESSEVARTGRVPMPQASEHCMGGHAVLIVGYDDDQGCFIVRNSWGESWGDQGYFWLPYAYIDTAGLASDFWTIRK